MKELIKKRVLHETYSKGDTHWNYYGAYVAFQSICLYIERILGVRIVPFELEEGDFVSRYQNADLLGKLGNACVEPQIVVSPDSWKCQVETDNGKWLSGRDVRFRSTSDTVLRKRVLVFHDSFGPYLERFIASSFYESRFVWSASVLIDLVKSYQPDLLIVEQVERFLVVAPTA